MDRNLVYGGSIPLDTDLLGLQQRTMIALGYLIQAVLGTQQTLVTGLSCVPTSPASLSVVVGPGTVIAPSVVETTPYGSMPANDAPLVKMGINLGSTTFPVTAPSLPGQSQNYLIQCAFSETDGTPVVLPYYNSSNPSQPYTGPGNNGIAQNTIRAQTVNLELKAGSPANAGTQVTPAPDQGFIGLWVITLNAGQVQVQSSSIASYGAVPTLAGLLNSHHNGTVGQAPKVILTNGQEVQGILPISNGGTGGGSGFARYTTSAPNVTKVTLSPGDWQTVTFSGQTSVPLGVNVVSGGIYRATLVVTSATGQNDIFWHPNDTSYASAFSAWSVEAGDGATSGGNGNANALNGNAIAFTALSPFNQFTLDIFGNTLPGDTTYNSGPLIAELTVSTMTTAKNIRCTAGTKGGGSASFSAWNDTTTAWTSLGTLSLYGGGAFSGVVVIERLA